MTFANSKPFKSKHVNCPHVHMEKCEHSAHRNYPYELGTVEKLPTNNINGFLMNPFCHEKIVFVSLLFIYPKMNHFFHCNATAAEKLKCFSGAGEQKKAQLIDALNAWCYFRILFEFFVWVLECVGRDLNFLEIFRNGLYPCVYVTKS